MQRWVNPRAGRARNDPPYGDHIRGVADYANHVRYCWINPVKHGLAARAVEWPYSSIHRDIARGRVKPERLGVVPNGE